MRTHHLLVSALLASCAGEPPKPTEEPTAPTASATAKVAAPDAAVPQSQRRVVVSVGRTSGTDVVTFASDGSMTVTVDVLENGRGPHVVATVRRAADGTIAALDAKGTHEMGTPVDEVFRRGQVDAQSGSGNAHWQSHEEKGDLYVTGPIFFVPMATIPDAIGWLAEALLKAGGKLPLLPGGEARIKKTVEATVQSGHRQRDVVGYVITGLDLTPTHVWMNSDGTWFGSVSPWWSVVPEGWESAIDPLIAKQNQLDRTRDAEVASKVAHDPPAEGLAYTNARVLDVEHGKWIPDQTVVFAGGIIQSVGPSATAKVPPGAETVDLAGKALMPGLWDMHAHLGDADGVLDIASGVTTARDVGNDPDKLDDYMKRYDDGIAVGPHVLRFGFIEGRNEKAASSKVTAETEVEAKAAVESFKKRGYDGIKIYNSVKPELVPVLAKEAHARGMLVTGHIPVHMLANEAVRAGYDGIEHINMLFLNFFADHDTDTRTTMRFTLVGDKAAAFDLGSKPVTDFFTLLADHHTVVDPTLDAFEDLLVGQQGKVTHGLESMAERLPVQAARGFLRGGLPLGAKAELYKQSFDKMLAMVKALHDRKITVVAGTDMLAGLMLHHELSLFVRAGISTADALKMATIEPARAMKRDKTTGTIDKGKVADLVVIDGDPLAHIEDLRKVVATVRGGMVFPAPPLYDAVGVRP